MFRCQLCGRVQPKHTEINRIVVERRLRTYATKKKDRTVSSKGWEIVKEIIACKECKERMEDSHETKQIA